MKNLSIGSAVLVVAVFGVLAFGSFSTAHAADLYGNDWYDAGTYDTWSDVGSYDNWYDAGSYATDDWYDAGSYSYDDWYDAGTADWYDAGTADWYDAGYAYNDYYGCGSYCGGGYSYDYGCGSSCYTYSIPGCSFCGGGYSTPRYSAPSSSYSNVVTNTNTNVNNVTNIDNSINDSFNNYNSNNTSLVVTAPQTPVYTHPAPYCTITSSNYGYGSGTYLSWTSTNASSAYISGIGSVSTNGSQMVYGSGSYTMTVYGYNGQSATCATNVYAYVPPPVYQQPYVSLTQIPYTGFDFGPIGNAMYWASLLSFAVAGAYLMVYYRGGALALATAMVPARRQKFAPIVAPKAPILVEKEAAVALVETKVQPIVASLRKAGTLDSMAIVTSKDGSMPKIVIQRA